MAAIRARWAKGSGEEFKKFEERTRPERGSQAHSDQALVPAGLALGVLAVALG